VESTSALTSTQRIAIVGIGGVFPGAGDDLDVFASNIAAGRSASKAPGPGRWVLKAEDAVASGVEPDKVYSSKMCLIERFELDRRGMCDDPQFWGLVEQLDPMFSLALSAGRDAWCDAVTDTIDPKRVSVIIGNIALPTDSSSALAEQLLTPLLQQKILQRPIDDSGVKTHWLNRYVAGLPAGVLARALGLGGSGFTLDAACASSLYAVKYAMDQLQAGRADAVLAGGLSRPSCMYTQMGFSQLRALSASGRCAPFDDRADGLVVGEGCGIVVLKRLDDALRDGDRIYATIAAVGLSNDIEGNLMLPATEGQLRAMKQAYEQADWSPTDIDLIECHGTGTPIGDAVEFKSMCELWQWDRERDTQGQEKSNGNCVIGSVKSNVGHLLTAAGSAGLIKTLLAMRDKTLPPTANFRSPASKVDLDATPFEVLRRAQHWADPPSGRPRRAAVSAFGFGGINAHLLLEQWDGLQEVPRHVAPKSMANAKSIDSNNSEQRVAIVGMASRFGPWKTLAQFERRVFGGDRDTLPTKPKRWRGAKQAENLCGFLIDRIDVPIGRFRIPPNELKAMLPQQLLMLQVAYDALTDTHSIAGRSQNGIGDEFYASMERAGVFIGIGLDLNTTNFHFRWSLLNRARQWAADMGLNLTSDQVQQWATKLRDCCSPPLTADRTMGALGGIVASRVARAFSVGGPSFTVSSEETSSLRALDLAVRSLQAGQIDLAITGAVDLAGDLRAAVGQNDGRPYTHSEARPIDRSADGPLLGEGAGALILKRYEDAVADGDRIYAVVEGIGGASGGGVEQYVPDADACQCAINMACAEARIDHSSVGHVEVHGSAVPREDQIEIEAVGASYAVSTRIMNCAILSTAAQIGHAGAATGVASLIRAALSLHHRVLPAIDAPDPVTELDRADNRLALLSEPQYWLANRIDGPRIAAVNSMSVSGECVHALLSESPHSAPHSMSVIGDEKQASLFVIAGNDQADVLSGIKRLSGFADAHRHPCPQVARLWWQHETGHQAGDEPRLGLALVVDDVDQLHQALGQAAECVQQGRAISGDRVFYDPDPLGPDAQIAFVFPGAGNQYVGMGRSLAARFPNVMARLDQENQRLADQFARGAFWTNGDFAQISHKDVIFSQVWLGVLSSDIMRSLGVEPDAAIGYSLGETTGQFALRSWTDRDEMLRRMEASTLFSDDLAGRCESVRRAWNVPLNEQVDWLVAVVDGSADQVRGRLIESEVRRVYLLIVNTPTQCVIGGDRQSVLRLINELGCASHHVEDVTTVHCDVALPVADAYRDLHLMPTRPPLDCRVYSGIKGGAYEVTRESVAESILGQALRPFNFSKVIEAAYADGARLFLEMGPGASCSRMIADTLSDRKVVARSICARMQDEYASVLRAMAALVSQRAKVDLSAIYDRVDGAKPDSQSETGSMTVTVVPGGDPFDPPAPPLQAVAPAPADRFEPATRPVDAGKLRASAPMPEQLAAHASMHAVIDQYASMEISKAQAQETFLRISDGLTRSITESLQFQGALMQKAGGATTEAPVPTVAVIHPVPAVQEAPSVALDRNMCMEFAIGSIAKVLGAEFAEADSFPTRVRLPDEPLMLVDRIMEIEGRALSMTGGRVVTEHDIHHGAWYLDGNRIPICIAVEAGQADLFLSGYLGIDLETRGQAVYRLLDAEVTFHRELPQPGKVIRYDIRIEKFFRHADTYMFQFQFDATVDGVPLLTMRNGCAGFFSQAELNAGQGIVLTKMDTQEIEGKKSADFQAFAPVTGGDIESYDDTQVAALRQSDPDKLVRCFGDAFAGLELSDPKGLPGGRMALVDRVLKLDPNGGRFGLGQIVGEADIRPDDWFLVCHFVDDKVMPGTLMYECCLHTLRIFLLRLGWVGESDAFIYEPVPGVSSLLKCRGQVIETTKKVQYELTVKEIGYQQDGTPYVLADALMYGDGKPIVQMKNMSVRLSGLTHKQLDQRWQQRGDTTAPMPVRAGDDRRPAIFDYESILQFSNGDPSKAFGDRYKVFDQQRRIARLPRPPYQFLDRIVSIENCKPWVLESGGTIEAQYDVPADAWYFASNRQGVMPYAVLLEIALQPCGWLAAYLGSALRSDVDLSFRNLGGSGIQSLAVTPDMGTLTSRIKITNVAQSGGMIIQNFDFAVSHGGRPIYVGDTYFGFFSQEALSNQIGIREIEPYVLTEQERTCTPGFAYPNHAPFADPTMRMIDRIDAYDPTGGPHGLGVMTGSTRVNPQAWFFNAHFYQDPVWPGSLGLESFIQLLKVAAWRRFGDASVDESSSPNTADMAPDPFSGRLAPARIDFETPFLGHKHRWVYRGQVLPTDGKVNVEAVVKQVDPLRNLVIADGLLSVDGRVIYQMSDFAVTISGH